MIPKILHYVWVGGNKKPKNIRRCKVGKNI